MHGTSPAPNVKGNSEPACHVLDELFVRVGIFSPEGVIEVRDLHPKGRPEDLSGFLKGQEESY